MRTSRAGLAGMLLERTRFRSHALEACSRVLKKRAAQSHLSMRVPVMLFIVIQERLDRSEHAAGEGEERGDELECAADDDADEAEGKEDEPDEWIEDEGGEGQGPAKESEQAEEQEVDHRVVVSCWGNAGGVEKVPVGG
jgi:hypothetical protein